MTCCSTLLCDYSLQEQVALARYSHLPVGNMAGDWVLNTADALFARCLRDADHLLWVNDPSLPDVAGPASAPEDTTFLLEQPVMEVSSHLLCLAGGQAAYLSCPQTGLWLQSESLQT